MWEAEAANNGVSTQNDYPFATVGGSRHIDPLAHGLSRGDFDPVAPLLLGTGSRYMPIKRYVPFAARKRVQSALHPLRERHAFRQLRRGVSDPPTKVVLEELIDVWGNPGYRAEIGYLTYVAEACAQADGPVLECGTGLTTIIAATYSRSGVWSLEQHAPSARRIRALLRRHGLLANVVDAPLVDHGDYEWYETSIGLPDKFAVVICDGPPGDSKGGRYGLLPAAGHLLRSNVTILLDDAARPGERAVLDRWQVESSMTWHVPGLDGRDFAVVKRSTP